MCAKTWFHGHLDGAGLVSLPGTKLTMSWVIRECLTQCAELCSLLCWELLLTLHTSGREKGHRENQGTHSCPGKGHHTFKLLKTTGGAAGGKGAWLTQGPLLFQVLFSYISIVPWLSFICVLDDLPTCTLVNTISECWLQRLNARIFYVNDSTIWACVRKMNRKKSAWTGSVGQTEIRGQQHLKVQIYKAVWLTTVI